MRDNVLGQAHDERSGFGTLWLPAARKVRGEAVDRDALCGGIEDRFDQVPARPTGRACCAAIRGCSRFF